MRYGRNKNRDIRITGVKNMTAAQTSLDVNGEQVSVAEYYYKKYEIDLR